MTEGKESSTRKYYFREVIDIIESNDVDSLKAAFETKDFDVNITDGMGQTALHHAVISDRAEIILETLASHPKINLNAKDNWAHTPLMTAAKYGKLGALNFLLRKGADALWYDNNGHHALEFAYLSQNFECVESLLKSETFELDATMRKWLHEHIKDKKIIDLLRSLIIEASGLMFVREFGSTVLHHACKEGSFDIVKLIVEKGTVDINCRNKFEQTPLHIALYGSFIDIADYLVQKGASLNLKDYCGHSAYNYAADYDKSETFLEKYEAEEIFLERMFKAFIQNHRFKTLRAYTKKCIEKYPNGPRILNYAIFYAFERSDEGVTKYLLSRIVDKEHIIKLADRAIYYQKFMFFELFHKRFLALETSAAQIMKNNQFLLHQAIYFGISPVVDYFLERGFDPNHYINYACQYEQSAPAVRSLIKFGADIRTCRFTQGFTPLLSSAFKGQTYLFFEIFKVDRNLSQRTDCQLTPLLAACTSGNMEIIKALIEAGACITDVDKYNHNCLHLMANNEQNQYFCKYMMEKLDLNDFCSLITAVDNEGDRPLDYILSNNYENIISRLWPVMPNLIDFIKTPVRIEIQKSEEEMCLICRDVLVKDDKAIVLPCKHVFHENCYKEWGKRKEICPYCQKPSNLVKK